MPQVDIAKETKKVGNALASVSVEKMILDMAKGIAWGQYELDKVGVKVTKMMGAPGSVSIGGEELSMLEAGFIPSFYHFVDTILELKMEVKIREETNDTTKLSEAFKNETSVTAYGEVSGGASGGVPGFGSVEAGFKAGFSSTNTSGYSKTADATHAQQFSQDLSASSLMRTKLVPKPAPELLVERINILLEKLRADAKAGAAAKATAEGKDPLDPKWLEAAEKSLLAESVGSVLLGMEPAPAVP